MIYLKQYQNGVTKFSVGYHTEFHQYQSGSLALLLAVSLSDMTKIVDGLKNSFFF
jgi:hypothetical protein